MILLIRKQMEIVDLFMQHIRKPTPKAEYLIYMPEIVSDIRGAIIVILNF